MQSTDFANPIHVAALVRQIHAKSTRPLTLMEVCGGQTHAILRYGIDQLLPPELRIVHGPGCPVCVTPAETIDRAIEIASKPGVIFCTFGDMLRVPGSQTDRNRNDLMQAKSRGADVRVIHSPLDAIQIALAESQNTTPGTPKRHVVLFAIGFETTAPATAMAIRMAKELALVSFSALVCHVLVPPALEAIFDDADHGIDGLLAAGHVCTIAGDGPYHRIAKEFKLPIAITGFEPVDLLRGILNLVEQLESKPSSHRVDNLYEHIATADGNLQAQRTVESVFAVCDQHWRGIGPIPQSGLKLQPQYASFDASTLFPPVKLACEQPSCCRAADVLRGKIRPIECPAFGTLCTPSQPLGAPMVSNEGACAAYFLYQSLSDKSLSKTPTPIEKLAP
jgi:hydrogenase expression/formation protein HypD